MCRRPIDDYRWLVCDDAVRWLDAAADDAAPLVAQTARLRKTLGAERAHLVLEQVELRKRGLAKFRRAGRMFFTRQGLEQATDQFVAAYKAGRFPQGSPVADLCCGIGGDLVELAGRGPAVGVDRDPVTALLAEANLRGLSQFSRSEIGTVPFRNQVRVADVSEVSLDQFAAWHIDPDRRPAGRRTTRPELHEPEPAVIRQLFQAVGDAAVKLAPAAVVPDDWAASAELEWISRDRQCRQLVAWFGHLATEPGRRRATVLAPPDSQRATAIRTLVGEPGCRLPVAPKIARYVFDPDPAVLAAGLTAAVAAEHGLAAASAAASYLTGDASPGDPALAAFEVTDVLPLDLKRLRRLIEARGIGRLEIKKRGVPIRPEDLRRRLRLRGPDAAVLLIAPVAGRVTAILARRPAS
jgi:hypothetical protein